jgi:DNA-3-methyladenine glycosylase I
MAGSLEVVGVFRWVDCRQRPGAPRAACDGGWRIADELHAGATDRRPPRAHRRVSAPNVAVALGALAPRRARLQNGRMTATNTVPPGLFSHDEDGVLRCQWCRASAEYRRYHDEEWGFPVTDERRLFEKICLEGFQAGLSWLTILNKREAFRKGFANFEAEKVARFKEAHVERLLADAGIVRHRGKIESTINNAKRVLELRKEFGSLAAYAWRHEPAADTRPHKPQTDVVLGPSAEAVAMSKDLKKRGWTFVGPTTVYAFMQAMGLVNDHYEGCHAREAAAQARRKLKKPE